MGSAAESNERSGHTEALYREHGAAVARLCRSLLRDRADAEDAAQQVFLSAHRALLSGAVPREPLAWLLAVARNECYARFRQRASAPLPAGDAPDGAIAADASVQVVRAGELASVWDEVGRMPAAQREAFLLREVRGLSYRQVGAELSLSPPSVRSLLLRARTRLRRRLGDVAAGLGGAQWVQTILRLVACGDAASPAPAAAKAAAVGLGAGGAAIPRVVQHAATTHPAATAHHRAAAHVRHAAAPAVVPAVRVEHRQEANDRSEQATGRGSRHSGRSRSHEGRDDPGVEDSGSVLQSRGSGAGAEAQATSAPAVQTTTSGHDGGGDSSSGSSGSSGGRSPGSDSGSVTTVATSGSNGSGSSGSGDSGGGDSHGSGSDGGSGGDGGGGHDGGSDG